MLFEELESVSAKSAALFGLRESIADLDSRSFELYSIRVLEANGYICEWDRLVKGRSVEHQVDIIAKKDSEVWLVECKRHFNPHRFTGLDVPLQVQARLEDIQDGFVAGTNRFAFTGAWIFTNTKFSQHAIDYSSAKHIRMTGWRSGEFGLEKLAEPKKVFPVTMLKADLVTKAKLLESQLVTLQDVIGSKKALTPAWAQLVAQAKQVAK
jgi:hypothetical protein